MLNLNISLLDGVFALHDLGDEMNKAFLQLYQAFNESPLKASSATPNNYISIGMNKEKR